MYRRGSAIKNSVRFYFFFSFLKVTEAESSYNLSYVIIIIIIIWEIRLYQFRRIGVSVEYKIHTVVLL